MGCHTNNNMACLIIFVKPPKPLQRRPQPAGEHHPARASDRPQQSGRPAAPGSPRPRPADPPRESAVTRRRTRRRTPPRDLGKAEHSIGQRLASGATTGEGTQNLLWADLARRSADRPHPQRRLRPLVGRSRPRARHRRARHQRRPPSLAREKAAARPHPSAAKTTPDATATAVTVARARGTTPELGAAGTASRTLGAWCRRRYPGERPVSKE